MERLRVLTLNIWNRQGPWEERLRIIRAGIKELEPDIVGLQEVIWREGRCQAHEIVEGLGYEVAFGKACDLGEGAEFGNAVLSRWPIARREVFPLPTGSTDESRSLLLAEIDAPHGRIPFLVTHLNWKLHHGAAREAQVAHIADVILREAPVDAPALADPPTKPAGYPPVLVGDLNASPDATEVRFLKGLHALDGRSIFFSDAYEIAGHGPGYTFDGTRNPFAECTHEHPRRIDYILVRGPDRSGRGRPLVSRVVFQDIVTGVTASDHFGVYAELSG
ncbi:MAG TPA: endonuclease/exonuclease/phosphatase family protein [Candidatus Nanopelagicales bacterium]|nr:endonuclease/exonuclease/phosphatase family protein [Candidatus Nanopelagicales bacterium]